MKPVTLVVLAIFGLLLGAIAARLLGLAWRTRRTPELLLGLSIAFPLLGYTIGVVGTAVGRGVPARWVAESTGAFCDIGFIATVAFVWRVFRHDALWAKALALSILFAFMAMPFLNHFLPWDNRVPAALVPRAALRILCYGWAALESLNYARLMRRRVRYGLAEPLVADRFSLWGIAHVCLGLMLFLIMAGVKLHLSGADFAAACTFAGFSFAIIAAVPLVLSFFPPKAYARYVEKRFRMEDAV